MDRTEAASAVYSQATKPAIACVRRRSDLLTRWGLESPPHVIWLLRHGDAADGSPDAERPLTEKGERQARNAGQALKKLGIEFEACLASPKVRAADTARI